VCWKIVKALIPKFSASVLANIKVVLAAGHVQLIDADIKILTAACTTSLETNLHFILADEGPVEGFLSLEGDIELRLGWILIPVILVCFIYLTDVRRGVSQFLPLFPLLNYRFVYFKVLLLDFRNKALLFSFGGLSIKCVGCICVMR
jgi:hypothetical protein